MARPMSRKRMQELEAALVDAASAWPEGTPVAVTKDDGSVLHTVTRSKPWMLCGTAVIMVDGISGGYMLTRVKPEESHG